MSKIVDALRRIQEDQSAHAKRPRKIARIAVDSVSHDRLDDTAVLDASGVGSSRTIHVDRDAMRDAGLIAPESESRLFEDEYRVIKRPILQGAFGANAESIDNAHVVLVSSALSGDGKTFTCINLALSIAREQDVGVVLVDADVRKPHISSLFDAQDEPGLLDYLDGSSSAISEIRLPTNVDGLSIVPTGRSRENSTELLSSSRMAEFITSARTNDHRNIVLIDSSPLLQTTESRALAGEAGQVVIVVHAGVTPKGAVSDALATLDKSKPTNLVLNQVRFGQGSGYYGGYYASGYGADYGESDVREGKQKT